MTTTRTGTLGRTLYYVLTGMLAIIFLFPLLWSLTASVSPQASTGQVNGVGLGNYTTLFIYGAGLVQFLLNSAYVALSSRSRSLWGCRPLAGTPSPRKSD
jgi:multiple sugar transport system permease protein